MMRIRVPLHERSYAIYLEDSYRQLPRLLKTLECEPWGCVISHRSILNRFGAGLMRPLRRAGWHLQAIAVPESERTKSYAMAEQVIRDVAQHAAKRVPVIFAFGGGVVGDLAGFVAAVYRRGVPYIQLPTTLLAQVDSAIGGKVGVDLPIGKNLVGAFYQPKLVFNHLGLLQALPLRQRRSGLSEVIKYGAIADPFLFRFLERELDAGLSLRPRAVRVMVERSCRIKARVVAADERDTKGIRLQLNFGHTLGHALEAATGYRRFTHGEAIAIGMACASSLSVALGWLPRDDHDRLISLFQRAGLPTRTTGISPMALKQALEHDKKFVRGNMRWVLLRRIGSVAVHESIPEPLMWRAIRQHVQPSRGSRRPVE